MAKMHQNRFLLRSRPHWGSLQRSPEALAGIKGPAFKEKGGMQKGMLGREGKPWERNGKK